MILIEFKRILITGYTLVMMRDACDDQTLSESFELGVSGGLGVMVDVV